MFEIHITTNKLNITEINQFKEFCTSIEAKPILIELAEGISAQQPMISKVFSIVEEGQLKNEIELLEAKFIANSYDVVRTKVEVPLDFINRGRKEFPNYKGQYYEWHGKVEFDDLTKLVNSLKVLQNAHISKNSLKDQQNTRFVTVRNYTNKRFFRSNVETVKKVLARNSLSLIKEEYEYCIYDSNKSIDKGWMDIPEITDQNYLNLLAFEAFLRRAANYSENFILKGSLLTRQYLKDINVRAALDLDFLYGDLIDDDKDVHNTFTKWVTQITESYQDDNVIFKSFKDNEFWRGIDYAMNDDFPTTNTDLSCTINRHEVPVVGLDISWNLPLDEEPIPLTYKPQIGESFVLPYTVPLSTQIAWKLHQSIVRPRAKDLIDVILMLDANKISSKQLETISSVFFKECKKDHIDPLRLLHYSNGKLYNFITNNKAKFGDTFGKYRSLKTPFGFELSPAMQLGFLDDIFKIDFKFKNELELIKEFEKSINNTGISKSIKYIVSNNRNQNVEPKHKMKDEIKINFAVKKEDEGSILRKIMKYFKN